MSKIVKTFENFVVENGELSDEEVRELQKAGVLDTEPVYDRFQKFVEAFNTNADVLKHLTELKRIHEELMNKFFFEEDYDEDDSVEDDGPSYSQILDTLNEQPVEDVSIAEFLILKQ